MAALAGFLTGREAAKAIAWPRQRALSSSPVPTAHCVGGVGFSAFCRFAKFAYAPLARAWPGSSALRVSMSAHPIIDRRDRYRLYPRYLPERLCTGKEQDGILNPEHLPSVLHCIASHANKLGPMSWICAPGWKPFKLAVGSRHPTNLTPRTA